MAVLITAGLSQEAHRLQRNLNLSDAIFADEEMPVIPGKKWITISSYQSFSFAHEMLKICLDHDIDVVYPLKKGEVIELSGSRQLFSEFNIRLMIPSDDWLQNNRDHGFSTSDFFVLCDGVHIGGTIGQDEISLFNETGLFTPSNAGKDTSYSLFVV